MSVRGNSSSRFSKYLFPNLSVAIKVPALVSPVIIVSPSSFSAHTAQTYQCSKVERLNISRVPVVPTWGGWFAYFDIPAFGGEHPVGSLISRHPQQICIV